MNSQPSLADAFGVPGDDAEVPIIPTTSGWSQERVARVGLSACCEVASPRLSALIAQCGTSVVFTSLRASTNERAWVRRAKALDLDRLIGHSLELGLRYVIPGDDEWPESFDDLAQTQLNDCGGVPLGVWVKGDRSLCQVLADGVAIVGSRASTPYGDLVAGDIAFDLARSGRTVISGGAYGIDAAAHRGALRAGGRSVAFLAGGLDDRYPSGNAALLDQLCGDGLLVSEYAVGQPPQRRSFLVRNRLIAAASVGTVVVEAGSRSGARNTVSWALACGRPVMAVPGPVTSPVSVSPHRLIRDSEAVLVASAQDVLAVVAPLGEGPELETGGPMRLLDDLPSQVLAIREVLPTRGGLSVAEVCLASGQPMAQTLAGLALLEARDLAEATGTGQWRVRRP